MLSIWKIKAYSTLVKAGKYILEESEREADVQILLPEEYKIAVADYLIAE